MPAAPRLLMIGLDAADPVLVDRWIADGSLPALAGLRERGAWGRLGTSARHLAGSPWPTFYTGQPPTRHGIYHDFQWRHERMGYDRPAWDWLPAVPFWRRLDGDVRVVALDVPMTLGCQEASGIELTGWASHDKLAPPSSHPPALLDEIRQRFGTWPVGSEGYGRSRVGELIGLGDHLLEVTEHSADLALHLLERPWDLAVVVFSALHRGGHRLWDRSSIRGPVGPGEGEAFDGALRRLYQGCDAAVGRLLDAAEGATVMVFSLHGMMANTTRADLLDGMLARVLGGREAHRPRKGMVRRLGESLPLGLRRAVTRAVPAGLKSALVTRWDKGGVDWASTPAFTLRADLQGYVRINLEGREPQGIVPPSAYDELCQRIADGLASFRDADTGEPLVEEVRSPGDGVFPDGPRAHHLPDLMVVWKDTPAAPHRAVVSDRFGRVDRETPGRIPNGRSGNHRPEGFLLAAGPDIFPGSGMAEEADILDLAPTALHVLGASTEAPLAGQPILPAPAPRR